MRHLANLERIPCPDYEQWFNMSGMRSRVSGDEVLSDMASGPVQARHDRSALRLGRHGAEFHPQVLSGAELAALRLFADAVLAGRSGARLFGDETLSGFLAPGGAVGRIAAAALGPDARAVRAVMFDKSPQANWSVAWHQDRTIAVAERREVPGFGPWSSKSGAVHVEPPFDILDAMVTLRAHLDDCDADNAPLLIAPGSNRLGRVRAAAAAEVARKFAPISCLAGAGDVWLYATPIIHASERARTPRRRRVLQVDYANFALPGGLEWIGIGSDRQANP
jgi:hypothetical protein